MYEDATYLQGLNPEDIPDFKNKGQVLEVQKVSFMAEYKTRLEFR